MGGGASTAKVVPVLTDGIAGEPLTKKTGFADAELAAARVLWDSDFPNGEMSRDDFVKSVTQGDSDATATRLAEGTFRALARGKPVLAFEDYISALGLIQNGPVADKVELSTQILSGCSETKFLRDGDVREGVAVYNKLVSPEGETGIDLAEEVPLAQLGGTEKAITKEEMNAFYRKKSDTSPLKSLKFVDIAAERCLQSRKVDNATAQGRAVVKSVLRA